MSIVKQLRAMPTPALIALVDDLYGRNADIDKTIEKHLGQQRDAPEPLPNLLPYLQRQVSQVTSSHEFIDYHIAPSFAQRLEQLLVDICELADADADQALALLDQLLERHSDMVERVDDSDGCLGEVLGTAVEFWLEVASNLRRQQPQARDWVAAVCALYDNNDYGCFDDLLRFSHTLLTPQELHSLAAGFTQTARSAIATHKGDDYNHQAAEACIGLRSVAEALGDIDLYEQAILLTNPQPNPLQLQQLVEFALRINALEQAEHWLQQPQWQADLRRKTQLHNQLLKLQGNLDQLKHNLLQTYQQSPSLFNLEAYWEYADPAERQALSQQIKQQLSAESDPSATIQTLLFIDAVDLAAEHLIAQHARLQGCWYGTLLNWLEHFEIAGQTLASIVCYRLLLNDLLDRGYSKAYHHGARYFRDLLELDKTQPDYRGLENAQCYIATLQSKHWRKRSFWEAAGHPNKALAR